MANPMPLLAPVTNVFFIYCPLWLLLVNADLTQGSGYFFHGKMPGCCLPSRTAATALHFTAVHLNLSLQQEPTPCFAFLGGNSPLPIRSTGAIILP
jgi:hypothetical protein